EMAKRTVINRAAKAFINTSDDSDLLVEAINNSTENEYDNERVDITPEEEAKQQIEEKANKEEIDFVDVEYTEVDQETGEIKEEKPDPLPKEEPSKPPVETKNQQQADLFNATASLDDGPAF